jgi:cyclic-di-GMP-binding protein
MAIETAPISKPGSMFFGDGRSCREWLKNVPITNVAQAQQKILDALRIVNRDPSFIPIERLTSMELLRDKVSFLLGEQRVRYGGKLLPHTNVELGAWAISINLLSEMEAGYRRCYQDAQAEDSPLHNHAALIIQRTIRYIGLGMLMAGFIYRQFDPAIWMRLHLQWIEAESRGIATAKVKDSIGAIDGYSSVQQAYVAVVLGQLANIYQLKPREIDFVDGMLKRFSHKVTVSNTPTPNRDGALLSVDVLAGAGAHFLDGEVATDHTRYLDITDLSKSLRRRARKLLDGDEPATLDLPPEWSRTETYDQLSRLHALWCEGNPPRPATIFPMEAEAIVAFGIGEVHFFLSGNLFEQPDVKRELSRAEMNDLSMFGRVSEATIRARYAEFNYGSETWPILDESRKQVVVSRPAYSTRSVAIGNLVGVRLGKNGEFYLSYITEIREMISGEFRVTLTMLPGKPEATAVRSTDNRAQVTSYVPGFRLPGSESMKLRETLIVPAGFVHKGRGIDVFHPGHGSPKQVMLEEFVMRGGDFDQVSIQ